MFENAQALASDLAHFACSIGLSTDLLELLIEVYPKSKDVDMKASLSFVFYQAEVDLFAAAISFGKES